ncbi:curlin [Limnobaculum parvum]|uniref:Curlin n=1 Tax=Limnobaculum parvum TaxID=2172103 RepID=A0A2Y9TWZ6_9GAMM|nr:curlin [Limnobaculum parvum]AWH88132.1 curlin [Limnobaculum parvum]
MKLWKIIALSSLVLSGSAMAGHYDPPAPPAPTVPQYTGASAEIRIYQAGTSNFADASQTQAYKSLTDIEQRGDRNKSYSNQSGDNSLINVDQFGNDNLSVAAQTANKAAIYVSQSGSGNVSGASQSYDGGLISVTQAGAGNVAYSNQH